MDAKERLDQAKQVFDQIGGDPQAVFAVIGIAKAVDGDPQKLMAILALAKFLGTN